MAHKTKNPRITILVGVLLILLTFPSYSSPLCQLDISRFKEELCRRHYDRGNSKSDLNLNKGGPESSEKKLALKSGHPPADPKKTYAGSLRIAEKAQGSKFIEELNCIAHWSILAAEAASAGALEQAREMAGWGFDDWRRTKGCPRIPEVLTPVEVTSQYQAYQSIVQRIEKLYPQITATQQKIKELKEIRQEVVIRKNLLKIKLQLAEIDLDKMNLNREIKSLDEQAEALFKEASEIQSIADANQKEVNKIRQDYDRISKDPDYSSKLLEQTQLK